MLAEKTSGGNKLSWKWVALVLVLILGVAMYPWITSVIQARNEQKTADLMQKNAQKVLNAQKALNELNAQNAKIAFLEKQITEIKKTCSTKELCPIKRRVVPNKQVWNQVKRVVPVKPPVVKIARVTEPVFDSDSCGQETFVGKNKVTGKPECQAFHFETQTKVAEAPKTPAFECVEPNLIVVRKDGSYACIQVAPAETKTVEAQQPPAPLPVQYVVQPPCAQGGVPGVENGQHGCYYQQTESSSSLVPWIVGAVVVGTIAAVLHNRNKRGRSSGGAPGGGVFPAR